MIFTLKNLKFHAIIWGGELRETPLYDLYRAVPLDRVRFTSSLPKEGYIIFTVCSLEKVEAVLNRVCLPGSRRGFFFLARSQQGQIYQQDSCQDAHQEFFLGSISWLLLSVVNTVLSYLSSKTFCKIEPSDHNSEIMVRQEINYSDCCVVVSIIFLHEEFCPDQHFRNRVLTEFCRSTSAF